ncbi:MAG: HAMP domain-containing sensor histidine kinase [Pseudomonadota bacterium]
MKDDKRPGRKRRRLPLAAQIVGLVVAALTVAVFVNVFIVTGERSLAVRLAVRAERIDRLVAAVDYLREREGVEDRQFRALSTRDMVFFTLERRLPVGAETETALGRALRSRLAEDGFGGIVSVRRFRPTEQQIKRLNFVLMRRVAAAREERRGRTPGARLDDREPPPRPLSIFRDERGRIAEVEVVAIEVAEDLWLNAILRTPQPPKFSGSAALALIVILAAVSLTGAVFARRIARPLNQLADAADRFGRGDGARLDGIDGPGEVARVLDAFERMQERLSGLIADQRRMLGAVGHDLRTPLASLRIRLENLEDGAPDKVRMIGIVDEMSRMTEEILDWSRHMAGGEETRMVDLQSLLASVCEDYEALGNPVVWREPEAPPPPFACKPNSLRRAVRNLIDNAVRYGGGADVSLRTTAAGVEIIVDDQGPGVPEAELLSVFEPFVRGEASRNKATGGVGLGLAVVQSVARAHGGRAQLRNRMEGGLRASIVLPAAAAR